MKKQQKKPSPYAKIEVIYPKSKRHYVYLVDEGGEMGYEWVEEKPKVNKLSWFIAGMAWAGVLASLAWVVGRGI